VRAFVVYTYGRHGRQTRVWWREPSGASRPSS
jgi:hypothetical protein